MKDKIKDKFILDACCGSRMFWFNKQHPNCIYIDKRYKEAGFIDNRPKREIKPDFIMDFTNLSFPDKSFKLVVMDPPHLIYPKVDDEKEIGYRLGLTYGVLNKDTWEEDIKKGFDECWRVLDDYGVLTFKWNDNNIPIKKLLLVLGREPLYGQKVRVTKSGRSSTYWFCFMKIPTEEKLK
jgi:hypothetical protein